MLFKKSDFLFYFKSERTNIFSRASSKGEHNLISKKSQKSAHPTLLLTTPQIHGPHSNLWQCDKQPVQCWLLHPGGELSAFWPAQCQCAETRYMFSSFYYEVFQILLSPLFRLFLYYMCYL